MTNPAPPSPAPRVSVVVLNWNGLEDTLACLQTLQESDYPNRSVVVVDNGSREDEAAAIQAQFPDVIVLKTGRNLGYAGGNNVGLAYAAQAGADYLFVLNNDTEVDPGCLSALVEAGAAHPEAGAVGCFVYAQTPPTDFLYAGLHTHDALPAIALGGRYDEELRPLLDTRAPVRVDSAHGCAFAMTLRAYEAVGGFDPRFFAVHEEVDWCLRAREAGFEIIAAPAARIRHKVAASFGGRSPDRLYYDVRNLVFYYGNRVRAEGRRLPLRWWLNYARCIRSHVREESDAGRFTHARAALEAGWDGLRRREGQRRPHCLVGKAAAGVIALRRILIRGRLLGARAYWAANARVFRRLSLFFHPKAIGK